MKDITFAALVLGFATFAAPAQDVKPEPKGPVKKAADSQPVANAPGSDKQQFADLSRLIQTMVAKEIPKEYEDQSGWGQTIPIPEKLRLPGLQRTLIKVGDKLEMPHGLWKRYKVLMEDPKKDLVIRVKEFSKLDAKMFRLALDADAAFVGEAEVKHWAKGLALLNVTATADALIGLQMQFDIGVTLNTKKFPPDIKVEPKLNDLKVEMKEFNVRKVGSPKLIQFQGDPTKSLGIELKDAINGILKTFEPQIKEQANEAIAQALKEGKGTLSPAVLFKLGTSANAKEKN